MPLAVNPCIDLLIQRAGTPYVPKDLGGNVTECDLVTQLVEGARAVGCFFVGKCFPGKGRRCRHLPGD